MTGTFDEIVTKVENVIASERAGRDRVVSQVPAPALPAVDAAFGAALVNALVAMLTSP